MNYTPGEQWIRLLHGYAPVMENTAMTAEHIGRLAKRTGIDPIRFTHPGYDRLLSAVNTSDGVPRSVILTGTAGDGKTSLCFDLYRDVTGEPPPVSSGLETVTYEAGSRRYGLTFIYDVTGWREKDGEVLRVEQVQTLTSFATSVFEDNDQLFVVAVNDGQLHEVFRYLPADIPDVLSRLRQEVYRLHATGTEDSSHRLRLINLSKISSKRLMELCLSAILDRPEWKCFDEESGNPLFSPDCSLFRNYQLLRSETVRNRVVTLAQLADAAGYHLPIRGLLCLLVNALLGNPAAKGGVLRPGKHVQRVLEQSPHKAALHRTLFGEHLSSVTRNKREVFRFLSMLQLGEETTNDLDELLIFGPVGDDELKAEFDRLVSCGATHQRSPELLPLAALYVRGDLSPEDTTRLLHELVIERRRLFLTLPSDDLRKLQLWKSSVFHYAGDYIDTLISPLERGVPVDYAVLQRLVAGLNRAWTGQLLSQQPDELYLCTGLDLTTASVSDILCAQVEIAGTGISRIDVRMTAGAGQPSVMIALGDREFSFPLTLGRFEFLNRVADGAMPTSFSREAAEDFAMLKQQCVAALCPSSHAGVINAIRITTTGKIERSPIHLSRS